MMKPVDISKRRKPKTTVWVQGDKHISFYQVWIYPYAKMRTGARVCFFRANKEKKVVCHIYLEEDFQPDPLTGEGSEQFIDDICAIAKKALAKEGVRIKEDYATYIDHGILSYDDAD